MKNFFGAFLHLLFTDFRFYHGNPPLFLQAMEKIARRDVDIYFVIVILSQKYEDVKREAECTVSNVKNKIYESIP